MNRLIYHIVLWIFILLYVFDYFVDSFDVLVSLWYTLFESASYAFAFYLNLMFLLPLLLMGKRRILYFPAVLLLMTGIFTIYYFSGLYIVLLSPDPGRAMISFFLNHSLFFILSFLVWHFNRFATEREKRLSLENEKLQMEMDALKSQISPHFLFNALNNIYTLSLLKSDDAPKMIASLSSLLRYFIYEGSKDLVYLNSELDAITNYIEMQRFRRIPGEANIGFEVNGETTDMKVPPLLIINLIENAFKHGDIVEVPSGWVRIDIKTEGSLLTVSVANSHKKTNKTDGIGLTNLKSQLDLLFDGNYTLTINETEDLFEVNLKFNGFK